MSALPLIQKHISVTQTFFERISTGTSLLFITLKTVAPLSSLLQDIVQYQV